MIDLKKMGERLSFTIILVYSIFLSGGCEPLPKMISYGSNEYSQLEFEGTSFDDIPLVENYAMVWAGKNFSIALYEQPYLVGYNGNSSLDIQAGLYCRGDSSLGQCDLPDSLSNYYRSGRFIEIDLGFNHGVAIHDSDTTNAPLPGQILPENSFRFGNELLLWGDNSSEQSTFPDLPDSSVYHMIAAGGNHNIICVADTFEVIDIDTFIVPTNFRIIAWGDNTYGQCNVPARFNPVPDSIKILSIDAGENHTIVVYDSSGVLKMAAWGDNTYGQLNVPSVEYLNDDLHLLEVKSGYNHNVAIFYDDAIDYVDQISSVNLLDTLYVGIVYGSDSVVAPGNVQGDYLDVNMRSRFHPVSIFVWGDNSYGQHDLPNVDGLFEVLDVGGYHNSIGVVKDLFIDEERWWTGFGPYNTTQTAPVTAASGREIISWGKNDFNQCEFPLRYSIGYQSFGNAIDQPGIRYWANNAPVIASGENHTLVSSPHLKRSPNIDFTFPYQFDGVFGDTLYQTVTLKNISFDSIYIDTLTLGSLNDANSGNDPPFYINPPSENYILFGDSISFEIYSVFDTSHGLNESSNIFIVSNGWWTDTTIIPIGSYFGPRITLSETVTFRGHVEETIVQELNIKNSGIHPMYLDSISITNPFIFEPYGEENQINSNDSLTVIVSTTLEDFPVINQGIIELFISNFNGVSISRNLESMRYLKLGDDVQIADEQLVNRQIYNCRQEPGPNDLSDPVRMWDLFSFHYLPQSYKNIYHFDFGYSASSERETYAGKLDSLNYYFKDNSYFASLIGLVEQESNIPDSIWYYLEAGDCDTLYENFEQQNNVVLFNDFFSESFFDESVESVIINRNGVITYLDTFNLQALKMAIETEIDLCGYDCLPDNSIQMTSDTISISIQQGQTLLDTITIMNITEHSIDYLIEGQSGTSDAHSLGFDDIGRDRFRMGSPNSDDLSLDPPMAITFWFKPTTTNFGNEDLPTTFMEPDPFHETYDQNDFWKIILRNDQGNYPRIGWEDEESWFLATTPILETFYFVTFTVSDGQSLKIYINGELEVEETLTNQMPKLNGMVINHDNPPEFQGYLSQTSVWSSSLNDDQVMEIFLLGPDADLGLYAESNDINDQLHAFWKMDDAWGYTIFDYSGNNFDAHFCCLSSMTRSIEIVQTGVPWLSMFGGGSGTLSPDDSRSLLFSVDGSDIEIGAYSGTINLYPEHNQHVIKRTTINLNIIEDLSTIRNIIPDEYVLHQNYPNPFNPITNIRYDLPSAINVKIDIYDIMGRKVKSLLNESQDPGFKSIQWNALNDLGERVGSGMYFYKIETSNFKKTKKMMLLK